MKHFKKILVAVDLANEKRFVADELPAPTKAAIRQAEWLAKANSAELVFFYVLPVGAMQRSHDQQILMTDRDEYKSIHDDASEVLAKIANESSKQGIRVNSKVVFGTGWIEMIREVLRANIDLVITGTRNQGPVKGMLFGSTSIKLLRKCPCPVWVTKPPADVTEHVNSILVAHDLTPVGDAALELGCSLAKISKSKLHVLHSFENHAPDFKEIVSNYAVRKMIENQLLQFEIGETDVRVQVSSGYARDEILSYIQKHEIKLLIMGTIARTGISGMLIGNTAENVLPFLTCSILAIKPAGFKSPVSLDD